jgi:signal peptidase II
VASTPRTAPSSGAASGEATPGCGTARRARRGLSPFTLAVAAGVVALDQLTKWLVVSHVDHPVHLVWTLRLVRAYNTGTAFSLGVGLGPLIALIAVVVVVLLARLGRAVVSPAGVIALGLVMGGAIGNLADRIFRDGSGFLHGAVVDFIDLQWWPVFNVADMAIVVGGALLILSGFGRGLDGPRSAEPATGGRR